jgi:hypothetical protein
VFLFRKGWLFLLFLAPLKTYRETMRISPAFQVVLSTLPLALLPAHSTLLGVIVPNLSKATYPLKAVNLRRPLFSSIKFSMGLYPRSSAFCARSAACCLHLSSLLYQVDTRLIPSVSRTLDHLNCCQTWAPAWSPIMAIAEYWHQSSSSW